MKTAAFFVVIYFCCLGYNAEGQPQNKIIDKEIVTVVFKNLVNNSPIVLYDSSYTNPFGETYIINKFKYYISAVTLYNSGKAWKEKNTYHLINQAIDSSLYFSIPVPENDYDSIGFLLGVDSARNTAGAQTGALDPLNDMFWTWHSGYVMEKLEGTSPQSNAVNNKMEYHLGGFGGENSVLNYIRLPFPVNEKLTVKKGKTSSIEIAVEINKFWNSGSGINISNTPVCNSPGPLAKQIAGNFSRMFAVEKIVNAD
jgi:hypothetical protein